MIPLTGKDLQFVLNSWMVDALLPEENKELSYL